MKKQEVYRKFIFIGIIIISIGITLSKTLKETVGALGTFMVAVGGLFFIFGISKKRKEDEQIGN